MKKMSALFLLALVQLFSSCRRAEPETYLIPANFTGRVQVIFNQNGEPYSYKNQVNKDAIYTPLNGEPMKYENGRRVYIIPSDGILLTQFSHNDGFVDREYYVVDSSGKRIPLKVFVLEHSKKDSAGYVVDDKNLKGIFGDGTSGSLGNEHVYFQEFVVSNYLQLNRFLRNENSEFDDEVEKRLFKGLK